MELKTYFYLFRRWIWLLLLGSVLGAAGAYVFSTYQPYVYQTRTKVMVMRSQEDRRSDYAALTDMQLAKTYRELLVTGPVLQATGELLGYKVSANQVSVREVPDSLLLEITVKDADPARAAEIANSLIEVFIEYNDELQTSQFTESEKSLQAQIDQVQSQIAGLQAQMNQISEETLQSQKQQVESRLAELDAKIKPLKDEIQALLPPTPTPTTLPVAAAPGSARLPVTPSPTPEPTATYTPGQLQVMKARQDLLEDKQAELAELQSTRDLYQQVYLNLLVYGDTRVGGSSNSERQNQLQGTLALYQQIYSNLLNSYENVRLARLRSTSNVVQIEAAPVPTNPVQPQPLRNAMLGGASGLLLMGAIAFLIEYLDDTLKTPEDVAAALNLPVIGLIGEMARLKRDDAYVYVADNPRSPITEAFRTLRTNLDFAGVAKPLKTLLITSASPSEGKTTVAVNLAAVMAQGERKVALVDADLRRPNIHRFLKIPNRSGLTEIFRNRTAGSPLPEDALAQWGEPPVNVLTSGSLPPNPSELLGSERMGEVLKTLAAGHDIVIIDGPPFIVADPVVLSSRVDGVVVVIEPGKTKIDAAQAMLEQLERAGARVVGAVLNPISKKQAHYYGGKYRYYSEYYYSRGYSAYVGQNGYHGKKAGARNGSAPPEKEVSGNNKT